jgi:hypothetical protein
MRGGEIKIEKLRGEELGYLIGIIAGDGYVFYDKKSRHYQVEFYLHSESDLEIIKKVENLLLKIGLNVQRYNDKRFKCLRLRVYSKELYYFIKGDKFNYNKEFMLGFVSGFIDSDGYYNKEKSTLVIVNTNLEKIKKAKKYLDLLNIKSTINKKFMSSTYKNQPYNLYISVKFIRLNHLSEKIRKS